MTELRVLTWNLRWNSAGRHAAAQVAYLADTPWDVAMLQEVAPGHWDALDAAGLTAGGMSAHHHADEHLRPQGKRPHGVALLVRNGLTLDTFTTMPGMPWEGRGLGATLHGLDAPASIASWHSPNAASSGPAIKMQGYLALISWIAGQAGTTVVGFDANHWETDPSLELTTPTDGLHGWHLESRFFGANAPHRLRDAYRDLLAHTDVGDPRRVAAGERGALAVTYRRGRGEHSVGDRFDYVFMSDDLTCTDLVHDYDGGTAAGSDHAAVRASLRA